VASRNWDAAATLTITGSWGAKMKCLRVYADGQGESHFSEMEIAMGESQLVPGYTIQRSSPTAAHIQFLTFPGAASNDWHLAPARQFVISLNRTFEIETSDGERRQVRPSNVILSRTRGVRVTRPVVR
jgi:hypothetical protein